MPYYQQWSLDRLTKYKWEILSFPARTELSFFLQIGTSDLSGVSFHSPRDCLDVKSHRIVLRDGGLAEMGMSVNGQVYML